MAFVHTVFREPGLLELSIDVAREHERAMTHAVCPPAQYREALVRYGVTVKLQAVSIEAPSQFRMLREHRGVCHIFERKTTVSKRWVSAPEAISTAKVRKAGVDTHAGTSSDEKSVGVPQPAGCFLQLSISQISHLCKRHCARECGAIQSRRCARGQQRHVATRVQLLLRA
jgi:hypothetical protein